MNYPIPPSHKTFQFNQIVIDSNFDSGNCSHAQKASANNYLIWIGVDHPKNQYRTWFYFSINGFSKHSTVSFTIKNMQNQSRLLKEGLVPVYREQGNSNWRRIAHKVDLASIEYNEGWIQWSFEHTMTTDKKTYLAFFYPWSNEDNDKFLNEMQDKCKINGNYFNRSNIIQSLEGRPIQFLTISSKKGLINKDQKITDPHLFQKGGIPKQFNSDKKGIVIGARVHPGEIPASHVMTGIISSLCDNSVESSLLLDKFVFYIFPIINPDGVARGHYRVDTNGINMNRCYINPSAKYQPSIYAIKNIILHLHSQDRYFAFLDLHAHAARKGIFIYGNSSDQLQKQVDACLFPKILSMNSAHFEYQGSNFTQKNMYCKQKNDHASKQGAGRVALFKATKNPNSWTIECNYNMSRVQNILQPKRSSSDTFQKPNEQSLNSETVIKYRYPVTRQSKQFYTIQTYHQFGKQICESLLDLVEMNPHSRIDNNANHFKSVQNLRINLAIALLRMAPNRFQTIFKKVYHAAENANLAVSPDMPARAVKALYLLLIKSAKIENINAFLKDNDESSVVYPKVPVKSKPATRRTFSMRQKSNVNQFPVLKTSRVRLQNKQLAQIQNKQVQQFIQTSKAIQIKNQCNGEEPQANSSDDEQAISTVFDKNNNINESTEGTEAYASLKQSYASRPSRLFVKNDDNSFYQRGVVIRQALSFQLGKQKVQPGKFNIKLIKLSVQVDKAQQNAQLPSVALSRGKPLPKGQGEFQRHRSTKKHQYIQIS